MRSPAADTVLWTLVGAALAAALAFAVAFPGFGGGARRAADPVAPPAAPGADPAAAAPAAESAPPRPAERPHARAGVVIAARRGDCWVEAREGSATGEVLFLGLVTEGRTIRLGSGRVWLRLGASENVEITVRGRRMPLPGGTVDVVV